MGKQPFTINHRKRLISALADAYSDRDELNRLVHNELGVNPQAIIAERSTLTRAIEDLVSWSTSHDGGIVQLVRAAYSCRNEHPELLAIITEWSAVEFNVTPLSGVLSTRLSAISSRRIQAQDWKQLHHEAHRVSIRLMTLRMVATAGNLSPLDLDTLWMMETRSMINGLSQLSSLPFGTVKQTLVEQDQRTKWLIRLFNESSNLDELISQCTTFNDLQKLLGKIVHSLVITEKVNAELLYYIDEQLQRTIRELDNDVENLRTIFPVFEVVERDGALL